MSAVWGFVALIGLLILAGAVFYSRGKKLGRLEAGEHELREDYEVKKARDRLSDPAFVERLRDKFR